MDDTTIEIQYTLEDLLRTERYLKDMTNKTGVVLILGCIFLFAFVVLSLFLAHFASGKGDFRASFILLFIGFLMFNVTYKILTYYNKSIQMIFFKRNFIKALKADSFWYEKRQITFSEKGLLEIYSAGEYLTYWKGIKEIFETDRDFFFLTESTFRSIPKRFINKVEIEKLKKLFEKNVFEKKEVNIRKANSDDAEMLTELGYKTYWDTFHAHPENDPEDFADYMEKAFNLDQIRTELADENSTFLVAEVEDEAVGYAKLDLFNTEDEIKAEKPIELNRIYSSQEFIGKGIGQKLLDESLKIAGEFGCDVIWLGVWELNPRAIRFYEKNGFYKVGTHIFQMGSDKQTDLLMQKELIE